jgi:methionyl-tRNA formyltransferase
MGAAFLGSPAAALPSLAAVIDVVDVEVVVTQPDRPRGRGGRMMPPPVKMAATEWGIPVAQPRDRDGLREALRGRGLDVAVVVAYGRLIPADLLTMTRWGFVNVHFSLLPRWRGAAPVERAILEGDEATGVSLMLLDEGLDTGPVISVVETPIADDETGGSLTARLSYLGAMLVDDALPGFLAGRLEPASQIGAGATQAPRLTREEARLDGTWEAERAVRAVRAFHPRPGAWMSLEGDPIKIFGAAMGTDAIIEAGRVEALGGRPVLGVADGVVELTRVQPPGKGVLSGSDWLNGRRGRGGAVDSITA